MSDQNKARFHDESDFNPLPVTGRRPRPESLAPRLLPPWRVILHNDDVNAMPDVVAAIHHLTSLDKEQASARMWEAHHSGCALLLVTHRERAELYLEQFLSCRLTVTIEPA